MQIEAHGKINWTLEVLGMRPDGYHELRSIVLPISLYDDVSLAAGKRCVTIEGCPGIPLEKNLIYIAARKLAEYAGTVLGELPPAAITVVKRIPAGSGLGGGSSDAAAALKLLNDFWQLDFDESTLVAVAASVGSDVPALLLGDPVLMEGRGECVRRLADSECMGLPSIDEIECYTPPIFSSTPAVYREFREEDRGQGRNDLQPAALRLYPEIAAVLALLRSRGLQDVAMSGSGSTVYGIKPRVKR